MLLEALDKVYGSSAVRSGCVGKQRCRATLLEPLALVLGGAAFCQQDHPYSHVTGPTKLPSFQLPSGLAVCDVHDLGGSK
jgi:hypothetical protein